MSFSTAKEGESHEWKEAVDCNGAVAWNIWVVLTRSSIVVKKCESGAQVGRELGCFEIEFRKIEEAQEC